MTKEKIKTIKKKINSKIKNKKKYYAMYDYQTNQYLNVGMNETNKKQFIDDVWDWWINGAGLDDEDYHVMKFWNSKQKKSWLENSELRIDVQLTKFDERDGDW